MTVRGPGCSVHAKSKLPQIIGQVKYFQGDATAMNLPTASVAANVMFFLLRELDPEMKRKANHGSRCLSDNEFRMTPAALPGVASALRAGLCTKHVEKATRKPPVASGRKWPIAGTGERPVRRRSTRGTHRRSHQSH